MHLACTQARTIVNQMFMIDLPGMPAIADEWAEAMRRTRHRGRSSAPPPPKAITAPKIQADCTHKEGKTSKVKEYTRSGRHFAKCQLCCLHRSRLELVRMGMDSRCSPDIEKYS